MATHCLHIGINDYRGSQNDLSGCVRDARDDERLFNAARRSRGTRRDVIDSSPFFGRSDTQLVLTDRAATRARVLREIGRLLKKLAAKDWGIITFSGHGTYVRDQSGDERDGFDEALVVYDLDVITDDELADKIEQRDQRSRVLVITDACHSGTATRSLGTRLDEPHESRHRVRFLAPMRLPSDIRGKRRAGVRRTAKLYNVIHFGACRDDQYAEEGEMGGRPGGVFTWFRNQALASLSRGAEYGQWFDAIRDRLPHGEYDQEPQANAYARALEWKIPTL